MRSISNNNGLTPSQVSSLLDALEPSMVDTTCFKGLRKALQVGFPSSNAEIDVSPQGVLACLLVTIQRNTWSLSWLSFGNRHINMHPNI